jgi:hypothetical protein
VSQWPGAIEETYQAWVNNKELFHPIDVQRFYRFVWACVDNPKGAPNEAEFRERLARDRKFSPDEQGYPHPQVSKAQTLYNHLQEFVKSRS